LFFFTAASPELQRHARHGLQAFDRLPGTTLGVVVSAFVRGMLGLRYDQLALHQTEGDEFRDTGVSQGFIVDDVRFLASE